MQKKLKIAPTDQAQFPFHTYFVHTKIASGAIFNLRPYIIADIHYVPIAFAGYFFLTDSVKSRGWGGGGYSIILPQLLIFY